MLGDDVEMSRVRVEVGEELAGLVGNHAATTVATGEFSDRVPAIESHDRDELHLVTLTVSAKDLNPGQACNAPSYYPGDNSALQ